MADGSGDGGTTGGSGAADASTAYVTALSSVQDAATRLTGVTAVTPVLTCSALDAMAGGRRLFFKVEALQKTGSFKARGAANAVLQLSDAQAASGVVTHSSGNHAQALVSDSASSRRVRLVRRLTAQRCDVYDRHGLLRSAASQRTSWCRRTPQR